MNRLRTYVVRPDLFRYRPLVLPVRTGFYGFDRETQLRWIPTFDARNQKMDNMNRPPCGNVEYQYATAGRPRQGALFAETVVSERVKQVRHFFLCGRDPEM
jgi:hypothetical protein